MSVVETVASVHSKILSEKLGHLYSLKPTLEYMRLHPHEVGLAFTNYCSLFYRFFTLSAHEQEVVAIVDRELKDNPHKSAVAFRQKFSGHEAQIIGLVKTIADPSTPQYHDGIARLTAMMTNAWDMKVDGLSPQDGDPRSDGVIWGYVRGAKVPELDMHFLIAHGTERIITSALSKTPLVKIVEKKDWSFPASTAIIGLDGVRGLGAAGALFPVWQSPRPDGLGWISQKRVDSFSRALAK
jgi:hypothetical protein